MRSSEAIGTTASPFGTISYFTFDNIIGEALRLYGQWAMAEIRFARQFISAGDVVLDGGANVGMHTLAFANACAASGKVIAVEASPEVAAILKQNLAANDLGQVELVNAALGAAIGRCHIGRLDPGSAQNAGMLHTDDPRDAADNHASTLEVDVVSIDSLNIDRLALIKLDIEGGEAAAIRGGIETIRRLRPVILVEALNLTNALPVLEMLTGLGYKAFFCSFAAFDGNNCRGEDRNIFGFAREASMLFVAEAGLIPQLTEGAYVAAIRNPDDLARSLMQMPRYGDRTEHDRVIEAVVQERNGFQDELARVAAPPRQDDAEAETHAFAKEIQHVWHSLTAALESQQELQHRIEAAEDTIGRVEGKADLARLEAVCAELRDLARAVQVKADAVGLAELSEQLAGAATRIDAKMDISEATEAAADLAARLARAEADAGRHATEVQALKRQLPVLSDTLMRSVRQTSEAIDETVAKLKAEVTSIRGALLGRSEDRARTALAVEELHARVDALGDRIPEIVEGLSQSVDVRLGTIAEEVRQHHEAVLRSAEAACASSERLDGADRSAATADQRLQGVTSKLDDLERRHASLINDFDLLSDRSEKMQAELDRQKDQPGSFWKRMTIRPREG